MTSGAERLDGDSKPITSLPEPVEADDAVIEAEPADTVRSDADLAVPTVVFVAPDPAMMDAQRAEIEAQWAAKVEAAKLPDTLTVEGHLHAAADLVRDAVTGVDADELERWARVLRGIDQALANVPAAQLVVPGE